MHSSYLFELVIVDFVLELVIVDFVLELIIVDFVLELIIVDFVLELVIVDFVLELDIVDCVLNTGMMKLYLWLVSKPPKNFKFYICDFVLKLLGTFSILWKIQPYL